jgi:CHAT domain-containing protein
MKQINVFILLLLILSCNFEKNRTPILDNFKIAEKEFNNYNTYNAIKYYKLCINPVKSEKDSIAFKAYCRLISCYYRINTLNELGLTFEIIDSIYKKNPLFKKFSYNYILSCALYNHSIKNYPNAAIYFQKALDMLPATDTLACFLNYKLGVCYEKQNNLNKAEFHYRKALSLARSKKDNLSNELSDCYNVIAFIYLKKYSDFYNARLYYDSALYISTHCRYLDSAAYAWNLFNIGNFYHYLGIYTKAEQYYFQSYNIYSRLKNWQDELTTLLYNQANIYNYLEMFDIAHDKIDMAISYYFKKNNPEGLQESYYQKAYIFFKAKEFNMAIAYYLKAQIICKKFQLPDEERILNSIGWCYSLLHKSDSAVLYFKRSMALFNQKKIKNINTFVSLYGEYSRMLIEKGKYNEALQTIENKLPYIIKRFGKKNSQFGYFIYLEALALEHLNRLPASLDVYQKVIQASIDPDFKGSIYDVPSFKVPDIISHDNLIDGFTGKADVLANMSMLPENKGQQIFLLQKSLQHYEKAREVVENYNKQIGSESNQLQFTSTKFNIYAQELVTAIQLYRITGHQKYLEKAFLSADRSKSAQLVMKLKDEEYKHISNVPDSLIQKEKDLQGEIELLQSFIRDEQVRDHPDSGLITNWRGKLLYYMNQSEKLSHNIDEKYSRYYQLKYLGNNINIAELESIIKPKKTLIEYAFAGDSLFTFVLSHNKLQLLSRPSRGIEDSVISFRNRVTIINDSTFSPYGKKCYAKHALWLYYKLIKPVESYLLSNEIIIVPDGSLNLLPFEALVTSDKIQLYTDYSLFPYLVYKYSICYAYSARLFAIQLKLKTYPTNKVLAFAPSYDNVRLDQSGVTKATDTISLTPLNSKKEVKNIIRIFGGQTIIGRKATKTNFKKHSSDCKILHLTMHSLVDNNYPMNSKLAFSQTGNSTYNGFLSTYEIYNLNIRSPLVVLNSCNTGYGKIMKGEGVISLARGFIYAGCPSMVITLWSVDDQSTSDLMLLFYKNLKNNLRVDKSLQLAKIQYLKNSDNMTSHPYYWAGIIQTGKTDSFLIPPKNHKGYLIVITVFSIIVIFLTFFFQKHSKNLI